MSASRTQGAQAATLTRDIFATSHVNAVQANASKKIEKAAEPRPLPLSPPPLILPNVPWPACS